MIAVMMAVIIIYICFILFYICSQISTVVKFRNNLKKYSAVLLMNRFYLAALVVVMLISLSMITKAAFDVLSSIQRNSNEQLPFAIYALPLITTSFSSALSEGLYAFGNGYLVGYKSVIPIKSVKLKKMSVNKLNRVKAVLSIHDQDKAKAIDIVMRTSKKNYDEFAKIIETQ